MTSPEYEEILASVQEIVRQAYALGRSDALKQVVEVLKTNQVPPKPLALMAPVEAEAAPQQDPLAQQDPSPQRNDNERASPVPAEAPQGAVHGSSSAAIPGSVPDGARDEAKDAGGDAKQPASDTPPVPWWARPARVA